MHAFFFIKAKHIRVLHQIMMWLWSHLFLMAMFTYRAVKRKNLNKQEMTTCLKFIIGRMKERVGFTRSFSTLNHVEIFPPQAFSVEMWSRFVPSDRLSGCGPAQERQGGKATHLQRLIHTPLDVENIQEVRRPTQAETIQRSASARFSCIFCSPTVHLLRGSTRASRSSGLMLGSLFTTQPFCTEVRRMNHSHECDLRNRLCTSLNVSLTNSTFSVNSQSDQGWNCKTSLQRHMSTRSDRANSWNLSLFKALDKTYLSFAGFWCTFWQWIVPINLFVPAERVNAVQTLLLSLERTTWQLVLLPMCKHRRTHSFLQIYICECT